MKRRRRRNGVAESGIAMFLLAATGVISILFIGKKLAAPKSTTP